MNETYQGCAICEVLPENPETLKIIENDYWIATLRENDQTLLGTTFITAKRHVYELDALTPEEDAAFILVRNSLLKAIRHTFSPNTFNVSCLKNDAFMADPDTIPVEAAHVHWHVKPRYGTQPVRFAGETFSDPFPGRYLNKTRSRPVSRDVAATIAQAIRDNLA